MNDRTTNADAPPPRRRWQVESSPTFVRWLADGDVSLVVTTYQVGKLLFLGRSGPESLAVFERSFQRAMGVWTDGRVLWLATAYQLWRMVDQFDRHERAAGFDRLFVPRIAYTTGDLDLHDVAIDAAGRPVLVATLFNCLATVSDEASFEPVWRPPFITDLTAEDRCHLNGLAMVEGEPKFVTLCAATDERKAWKDHRRSGGQVLDVASGAAVATGLSMPHSPRWHQGKLWLLNSGNGYLGYVDLASGKFEPVAFCPGYARGLAFVGNCAVVGLSRPRERNRFGGLGLDEELARRGMTSYTGLAVVDLATGETIDRLEITGDIAELYDVAVLPGVVRPKALGLQPAPLRYNVWAADDGRRRHWRSASVK